MTIKHRPIRIIAIIVGLVIGLALLGSAVIGYFMSTEITSLTTREGTSMRGAAAEKTWLQDLADAGRLVNVSIPSQGQELPITYYYADEGLSKDHDTVILVHGLGSNRHHLNAYVKYFMELGFNALTYDQRATNENPQDENAFGFLERLDLEAAVEYVRAEAPDKVLGLWGESFGGATVGLGLALESIDSTVDFAILDSPMSQAKSMIMPEVEKLEIPFPGYFYRWASWMTKLRLGFTLDEANVVNYIASSKTPLLVIYSESDTVTPAWMASDIYEAATAMKDRLVFEDASHAYGFYTYPEEYKAAVEAFLGEALG